MGASFLANKVYPMTGGESKSEDTGALGLGPGTPPKESKEELVPSPDPPRSGPGSSALADDDVREGGGVEYPSDTDSEEEEEDSEEDEEVPVMNGGGNTTWINPHGGLPLSNHNTQLTYQF